jgi:hypothetical protein
MVNYMLMTWEHILLENKLMRKKNYGLFIFVFDLFTNSFCGTIVSM